jgi:FeS assembly SUF system protein
MEFVNYGTIADMEDRIVSAIKTCYDPEIPVDIYELGLIYKIEVKPDNSVYVEMTLTSPSCPAAGTLPGDVEGSVKSVEGVTDAIVDVVFEPTWEKSMMSEIAMLELGFM